MQRRSPLPLSQVLSYTQLESGCDHLKPGSIKYVGMAQDHTHYWSYPTSESVSWIALADGALSLVDVVPESIQQSTLPRQQHATCKEPRPPKRRWEGSNLPEGSWPKWVPSSRVGRIDIGYVAEFEYPFDMALKLFNARATSDQVGGGAGLHRQFFLELARNRLAALCWWERRPHRIQLHLHCNLQGRVDWEDFDQVMDCLELPLEQVFRQGGLVWRYRKPTPERVASKKDHYQRMWIAR